MKACRQCGLQNEEGATFCGNCGEFLAWEQTPGDAARPASPAAPTTDPATPVEPGNLLQQANVSLQPDQRKPNPSEKPGSNGVSARTVDIGVSASPAEVFVEPGAKASCEVRVLNSGSIVDRV